MKSLLLSVRGVGVCYPHEHQWAIRGIDLEIQSGEIVSLIGPNGAGKSTLLRVMAGLLKATEGRLAWPEGRPIRLGYVPQQPPLDRSLPISVEEFLGLKFRDHFLGWQLGGAVSGKLEAQLRESGISHLRRRKLGELSGGELQRVMMAYSLLDQPEVLLLDEPLTGVDVQGGEDFCTVLRSLRDRRHLAVIMVSHDLHMVGAVSDRVVCLNRSLCCSGTPQHMLQEHVLSGIFGAPLLAGLVSSSHSLQPHHHRGLDCCGGHHG